LIVGEEASIPPHDVEIEVLVAGKMLNLKIFSALNRAVETTTDVDENFWPS